MVQGLPEFIGREVRAEMARQGVRQRDLAEHLGLSQPQVGKRLAGEIEFRPSELAAVAELLRVPLSQFFPVETPVATP
jgi:transcriptional regulator with XRE-family HTH domain